MLFIKQSMWTILVQISADELHLFGVLGHFSSQMSDDFHNFDILCMFNCCGILEDAYVVSLEGQQVVNFRFV